MGQPVLKWRIETCKTFNLYGFNYLLKISYQKCWIYQTFEKLELECSEDLFKSVTEASE